MTDAEPGTGSICPQSADAAGVSSWDALTNHESHDTSMIGTSADLPREDDPVSPLSTDLMLRRPGGGIHTPQRDRATLTRRTDDRARRRATGQGNPRRQPGRHEGRGAQGSGPGPVSVFLHSQDVGCCSPGLEPRGPSGGPSLEKGIDESAAGEPSGQPCRLARRSSAIAGWLTKLFLTNGGIRLKSTSLPSQWSQTRP